MPHSGGRIYTETRDGVKYGIDIRDIQQTLGHYSNDVGTLCQSPKINMYAKHKPIRYNSPSATYENTPLLYRGADNKCGIEMPILTHADFILDTMRGYNTIVNANDHTYLYPRGRKATSGDNTQTADEWFRVLDFNGYRTFANLRPFVFDYPAKMYKKGAYGALERHHPGYCDREIVAFEYRTAANLQNAYELALLDIMSRFSNYSSIATGNTCGYIGILLWCGYENPNTGNVDPVLYLRSHSIISGQTLNYIDITPTQVDIVPALGQQVMLLPCIPNYDTDDAWINTQSLDSLEIILFPKSFPSYKVYTVEQYLYIGATMSYSPYSQVVTELDNGVWTVPRNSQNANIGITVLVTNVGAVESGDPYAPTLEYTIAGGVMDGQTGTVNGTYNSSTGKASYTLFGRQVKGSELFTYSTPSIPESVTITFNRQGQSEYAGNQDAYGSLQNRQLSITRLGV